MGDLDVNRAFLVLEGLKKLIGVLEAVEAKHRVEWRRTDGGWEPLEFVPEYRIIPALRPWRVEEVPLCGLVRPKAAPLNRAVIIGLASSREKGDPNFIICGCWGLLSPETMLKHHEHSVDGGKTWLPCGMLDGGADGTAGP